MGSGFSKQKKQAKQLQNQLMQAQTQMQNATFTGTAGNGLVTVTIGGDFELKKISIKPECVDPEDIEGLELLIAAAFKDASTKAHEKAPNLGGLSGLGALGGLGF